MEKRWRYFNYSGRPGEITIDVDLPTLKAERFAIDLKLLANRLGLNTSCFWKEVSHRPGRYGSIRVLVLKLKGEVQLPEMVWEKIFSLMDEFAEEMDRLKES